MSATFDEIMQWIENLDASPNQDRAGRTVTYSVPNALLRGAALIRQDATHKDAKQTSQQSVSGMASRATVEVVDDDESAVWSEIGTTARMAVGDESYWDAVVDVSADDLAVIDSI